MYVNKSIKNRSSEIAKLFGSRLKELREERKLSQKTVSDKLGVAPSTYANWEQGRREPCLCDIFNLLSAFEIDANELFDIK